MKRGIALVIALFFLAAMSILLERSFAISEKFSKDDMDLKNLTQINLVIKDTKAILPKVLTDINSTEALDFLFSQPFVIDGSNFDLSYAFEPIDNAVNPNKLLKEGNKVDENFKTLIESIFLQANVLDSHFLINILLDTIDNDQNERVYGSEIALKEQTFSNGSIYSWNHFEKILQYYSKETNDQKIFQVDWKKYFNFQAQKIDINFASLELLKILFPSFYIDKEFKNDIYESWDDLSVTDEEKAFLQKVGVVFISLGIKAQVAYTENQKSIFVDFLYDIENKKSQDFQYFF